MNDKSKDLRTATRVGRQGGPMRRLRQHAVVAAIAVVATMALVGLSGTIVFADLKAPRPSDLADRALQSVPPMQGAEK